MSPETLNLAINVDTSVTSERLGIVKQLLAIHPRFVGLILSFPPTKWLVLKWLVAGLRTSVA